MVMHRYSSSADYIMPLSNAYEGKALFIEWFVMVRLGIQSVYGHGDDDVHNPMG